MEEKRTSRYFKSQAEADAYYAEMNRIVAKMEESERVRLQLMSRRSSDSSYGRDVLPIPQAPSF